MSYPGIITISDTTSMVSTKYNTVKSYCIKQILKKLYSILMPLGRKVRKVIW